MLIFKPFVFHRIIVPNPARPTSLAVGLPRLSAAPTFNSRAKVDELDATRRIFDEDPSPNQPDVGISWLQDEAGRVPRRRFAPRTTRKTAKAMIVKVIAVVMKFPTFTVTAPAFCASANVA